MVPRKLRVLIPAAVVVTLLFTLFSPSLHANSAEKQRQSQPPGGGDNALQDRDQSIFEGDDLPQLTNSSLSFTKLVYLNVPSRYDLDDTITLQSTISGLRPERFEGVTIDDLTQADPKDASKVLIKGQMLGPSVSQYRNMRPGVVACYRSHANIWRTMIKENWKTLLVLEGDAAWDRNIRHIMPHFSRGLEQLMRQLGKIDNDTHVSRDDPYLAEHWDYINFGGCYPSSKRKELSLQYYDPYAPEGTEKHPLTFHGTPIKPNHRVVRHQAEEACTGAYAITRRGAMKLLLRTVVDMNQPVDLLIRGMISKGILENYSVFPILFNQSKYRKDLGPQSKGSETGPSSKKNTHTEENIPWKDIREKMSIWEYGIPGISRFKNGILLNFKDYIFTKTEPMLDTDLGGRD